MFRRKVSTRTASLTLGSCILAGTVAGFVLPMSLAMSAEQCNGEGRSFVVIDGTVTYDD